MSTQDNPISAIFAPDSLSGASQQIVSRWTISPAKRVFDVTVLLVFTPLWIPLLIVLAVIVRFSSPGPVIFQQERIGRSCRPFTIYKFRTMRHDPHGRRNAIAAVAADEITPAGHILRRFKLDELPQLINVLLGHMSLVGPRPKVPEQQMEPLPCHPGITGYATLAFAREEVLFSQIPEAELNAFYRETVLPAKYRLDADYMRCATFSRDLGILMDTVLGKWGSGESAHL